MQATRRPLDRAQAGAALTIPFIVVVILLIAALGLFWVTSQDVEARLREVAAARAEKATVDNRLTDVLERYQALANVVGYRDSSQVASKSDPAGVQASIDAVRARVGAALGTDDATLEDALNVVLRSDQASQTALAQAQADHQSAQAARQAAEAAINGIESNYKQQLATLNQQLRDEQARSDNQSRGDQQRFDDLLASEQNKDAALRAAQRTLDETQASSKRELATAEATISSLTTKKHALKPDEPDGELLSVSDTGTLVYLDIGGRDGLELGTRFDVLRRGQTGELYPVGQIEVRQVDPDMAMAGVLGEVDARDPLLPGDQVRNPHFRRGGSMHFYLLGEFPLTMSREFVVQRLADLGATVDDQVSANTDVVIMGHESLAEGEFAQALTESDEFILADKLGLRVMRLDELTSYLSY